MFVAAAALSVGIATAHAADRHRATPKHVHVVGVVGKLPPTVKCRLGAACRPHHPPPGHVPNDPGSNPGDTGGWDGAGGANQTDVDGFHGPTDLD